MPNVIHPVAYTFTTDKRRLDIEAIHASARLSDIRYWFSRFARDKYNASLNTEVLARQRLLPSETADIRYNGGGLLDIASEVAYMIAGPTPTSGQTFEVTQFNSKYPTVDPVTGATIVPLGFHTTTQGFSVTSGQALPTLNLQRVFVLTGSSTCSASESIIDSWGAVRRHR